MPKNKNSNRQIGVIIDYKWQQGIGTISLPGSDKAVFFNYKELPIKDGKYIRPSVNQKVEFDLERDIFYGLVAKNIKILN